MSEGSNEPEEPKTKQEEMEMIFGKDIELSDEKLEGPKEVEEEPKEVEEEQVISVGSKVKWTGKDGKEIKGEVEKETASNYKICCKPGKKSGDTGSVFQVPKGKVKLDQ